MYSVKIKNEGVVYSLHDDKVKLSSGKVVKGINTIDSFSFTMSPLHPCFHLLHDLKTQIEVTNESRNRVELAGRVLYTNDDMDESGKIVKEVVCESCLGYLCDSEQEPVAEKIWTVEEFLGQVTRVHNSQVERYKQINLVGHSAEIGAAKLKAAIQRENTWETIKKNLLDTLGYEIIYSNATDYGFAIEIVKDEKNVSETKIELSRNMKSISRERDPSEIVTRLEPLGFKKVDSEGHETGERVDITSANNGIKYIEDTAAKELFGIRYKSVEFDDMRTAKTLLQAGLEWLANNNKVRVKYTVTALDLSLLGLDIDDFDVRNYHPLVNPLLGIDDAARIIKKNIDICEEVKSSFDIGDNFETVSDIQIRRAKELLGLGASLAADYAGLEDQIWNETSRAMEAEASLRVENGEILAKVENTESFLAEFQMSLDGIRASVSNNEDSISELKIEVNKISASVSNGVTSADLALEIGEDGIARISANADAIHFESGEITISSDKFKLDSDGIITCSGGTFEGSFSCSYGGSTVTMENGSITLSALSCSAEVSPWGLDAGGTSYGDSRITHNGWQTIGFNSDGGTLYGTWYGSVSEATTSDVNKKHDIEDLTASYSALFDGLTPRLYKYNDGTSNRVHVGFIAQEVEAAINAVGLTTQDFAGFVRAKHTNTETGELEEVCCLRYEEFIALCVNEIQSLKKKVEALGNG